MQFDKNDIKHTNDLSHLSHCRIEYGIFISPYIQIQIA